MGQHRQIPLGSCLLVLGLLATPAKAQTVALTEASFAPAAAAIGAAPVSGLVLPEGTPDLASDLLSSLAYAAGQSTDLLTRAPQATLLTPDGGPDTGMGITAQAGDPAPAAVGEAGPPVALARVGVRYTTEGAGYRDGFTTFEGFVPLFQNPGENLTFLEGRLLLLNNSTLGTNVVVGHRIFSASDQRVYGGYIAYDNRDTGRTFFNQVGFGLEALSDDLDLRLNAYFPVGTNRNQVGAQSSPTIVFSGNSLLINTMRQFEAAATVVDAEVGTRLFPLGDVGAVRGYAGTYYINAQGSPDVIGVRGRLEAKAYDYLNLNLLLQNDSLFDTRFVVSVGVTFPGTISSGSSGGDDRYRGLERIGDSVVRQSAILVADPSVRGQSENRSEAAINARTGRPYRVVHVASGSGGSGTNESPLGSVQAALAQAGDGDIVYVRGSGNETFASAPNLPSGVALLFSRIPQLTPDPVVQFGRRIPLPTTYLDANARYIINLPGTLTITGNNVTVSGLTINNPAGPGILANGVSNLTLTSNTINNAAGRGIDLTNVTGNLTVADNVISGTTGLLNSGLVLQNNTGSVNFSITGNTITGTTNHGIGLLFQGNAQATGTIASNSISGNQGSGVSVQALDNSQVTLTISNNQLFNNGGVGIDLRTGNSGVMRATIESNPRISGNTQGGIVLRADNTSQLFARVRLNPLVSGNNPTNDPAFFQDLDFSVLAPGARLCLLPDTNTIGNVRGSNAGAGTLQVEGTVAGTTSTTGVPAASPAGTCGF